MVLPTNCETLRNVKDCFYYNGIEISKRNFDVREFAIVCKKINDIKEQIYQEQPLNYVRQNNTVIANVPLYGNTELLCKIDKKILYFGLYDTFNRQIIPLSKDLLIFFFK